MALDEVEEEHTDLYSTAFSEQALNAICNKICFFSREWAAQQACNGKIVQQLVEYDTFPNVHTMKLQLKA